MRIFKILMVAGLVVLGGMPAAAGDVALVMSNSQHRYLPFVDTRFASQALPNMLRQSGFEVFEAHNKNGNDLRETAERFINALGDPRDRVFVYLSGHFVSGLNGAWLLGLNANTPSALTVGAQSLSVSAINALLADHAGHAVMVVATPSQELSLGRGLTAGLNELIAAQGVTVIEGTPKQIPDVVGSLLEAGTSMSDLTNRSRYRGVTFKGYLGSDAVFTAASGDVPVREDPEAAYWSVVQDMNTKTSYEAYLRRYPSGRFAADARRGVESLHQSEAQRFMDAEAALRLSRDARRQVQRDLALLGFDPKGVDGVFGRGSRTAIAGFQRSYTYQETGYLDGEQLRELRRVASIRERELEDEARRRQDELERNDRDFWQRTGAAGNEAGYRDYLRRYPDGLYSAQAYERLRVISEERGGGVAERRAWANTQAKDTIAAYRAFLKDYPYGAFSEMARVRLAESMEEDKNSEAINADKATERSIAGNPIARILVERRLADHKMSPGPIDGKFTKKTRKAIRNFQRKRGLPVTGYVSQATMVQLMSR